VVLAIEVLVVAALVFVVAALAVGWFDRMAPAPPDAAPTGLPADGPVGAREVGGIRLNLAFRGYRMAEVDALLERLAEEREAADRVEAEPPVVSEPASDSDPPTSAH
jgi:DivIVA domain-containing protein